MTLYDLTRDEIYALREAAEALDYNTPGLTSATRKLREAVRVIEADEREVAAARRRAAAAGLIHVTATRHMSEAHQ